ncbi:MAG: uridine kinase [Pyrinomonadaceae bacterium]|nr:uridine kinase [Pyrinomonadaceae bacterium]
MIIGICGGTGSGKTTIARRVIEKIGKEHLILIEQDSYYLNLEEMPLDERHQANFDHPDSIDFEHLRADIAGLRAGKSVESPIYDFHTHTRRKKTRHLKPKPIVIIEGILIFAVEELNKLIDVKVFVDTADDIRFIRRMQRDILERGRSAESVIAQYYATVRPMHNQFVAPCREEADVIIPDCAQADVGVEMICSLIRDELARRETAGASV